MTEFKEFQLFLSFQPVAIMYDDFFIICTVLR
jgi:hypothetical protein